MQKSLNKKKKTKKPQKEIIWGPAAMAARRDEVRKHQTRFAKKRGKWIANNPYFYKNIKRLLQFIIEPQKRVLHIRSETGFLLSAVNPSEGIGIEVSQEMVDIARERYPQFQFIRSDPEELSMKKKFDYILFSHISDTIDVINAFRHLKNLLEPHTRLIIYTYNHLWQPIIKLAELCRIKMPMPEQNWLSEIDIYGLLNLSGFEHLRTYRTILFPKWIPFLSWFLNRVIAKLPLLNRLCMTNVIVARPFPLKFNPNDTGVSVIVPCKNERGNIEPAVQRIPNMGKHTEIIFCDDKSTDGTAEEVLRMQEEHPDRDIKLVEGPGICKAENVWTGFDSAKEDVFMILDADLTVMPEELPYFFQAITEGKGDFINGSRMVYPVQKMAMKFSNMLGNKAFSLVFSYLLSQKVKDTLCGTKVMWRSDWERMKPLLNSWGVDRWGDYKLLFSASKLHLRIVDLPVNYQERIFGTTKMVRVFQNGLIMLRMCFIGFRKLKLGF